MMSYAPKFDKQPKTYNSNILACAQNDTYLLLCLYCVPYLSKNY